MSVRVFVAATLAIGLSGCDQVSDQLAALPNVADLVSAPEPVDETARGVRTLSVLRDKARVRGPDGYCIDQGASQARDGFVVMVGCPLLTDQADLMPLLDGLITVQFGGRRSAAVEGNEDALSELLKSDAGRDLLAFGGDTAGSVGTVETARGEHGVMARFEDSGPAAFAGTTGMQWRGFMDIENRLVTVSVRSFERDPLSESQGDKLLAEAMAALRAVNTPTETPEESG